MAESMEAIMSLNLMLGALVNLKIQLSKLFPFLNIQQQIMQESNYAGKEIVNF